MMKPSSRQAMEIYRLTNYFFIVAAIVLLLVSVLTILFLYKYRERPGYQEQDGQGSNKRAEIFIVGIPLLTVTVFFVLTVKAMHNIQPPVSRQKPDLVVTGHQWWWQAYYPDAGVNAANEIHLPTGKKLLLQLNSADVIHDWWVPELGNKMDLVPGRNNFIWLTIDTPGVFEGVCSEFCGQQHAWMRLKVFAESPSKFAEWLKQQQNEPVKASTNQAKHGAHLFQQLTCGNCHKISGIADGNAGPDLSHIASRTTLLAGMLPNNEENLRKWLSHPRKIKPGAYMPDFRLDSSSVNALAAFLAGLQ